MTTATNFEWITPVDEYVLRQSNDSGWLKITQTNTEVELGASFMPLPLGNLDVVTTWDGTGSAQLYYLPDGNYSGKQMLFSLSDGQAYKRQVKHFTLAVDNPDAKIFIACSSGQSAYTAGVKIIKSTIDFKEQEE